MIIWDDKMTGWVGRCNYLREECVTLPGYIAQNLQISYTTLIVSKSISGAPYTPIAYNSYEIQVQEY